MLRIDLRNARPGMTLALPLVNPATPTRTLLKVGFQLTEDMIDRLLGLKIRSAWVRYPNLAFLEEIISVEAAEIQNQIVGEIANAFELMQRQATAKLDYGAYLGTVQRMVQYVITNPSSAMFLGDLVDADDYWLRHSSNVTYLSILLGMKLECYIVRERKHVNPARAKEVANLGLGAMLHDVGVVQLEAEVRRRFEQTGDASDPQWREHTALGYRTVRGQVDPTAATVVLHHHQHYNGTGFAGEDFPVLREKRIHIFGRISAVADQFDSLRHPIHGPARPTVEVLRLMTTTPLASCFDPQVLKALLYVTPPYAPGTIVKLSDGRWAAPIDHHPDRPCRPQVSLIECPDDFDPLTARPGETIDLLDHPHLHIVEQDGVDVSRCNFELPKSLRETYLNSA